MPRVLKLERSLAALEKRDARYFLTKLPHQIHWRLYSEFSERVAYLDIETTGLGAQEAIVTVIGVYDGERPRVYVHGRNLEQFVTDIESFTLLVTYNGQQFDLPFLRTKLGIPLNQAHIDLRYPLAALGYKGGLKKIEQLLGLERPGLGLPTRWLVRGRFVALPRARRERGAGNPPALQS